MHKTTGNKGHFDLSMSTGEYALLTKVLDLSKTHAVEFDHGYDTVSAKAIEEAAATLKAGATAGNSAVIRYILQVYVDTQILLRKTAELLEAGKIQANIDPASLLALSRDFKDAMPEPEFTGDLYPDKCGEGLPDYAKAHPKDRARG